MNRTLGIGALLLFGVSCSAAPVQPPNREAFPQTVLRDTSGRVVRLGDFADRAAVVVVFVAPDCPMSNGEIPKLLELDKRFARQGVQMVAVHCGSHDAAAIAEHARQYRIGFPVLIDDRAALAAALGAEVTPQAVVIDRAGKVRYSGRIDDQYSARLVRNGQVTRDDLRLAIEAVLAGKPVEPATAKAFGCPIDRSVAVKPTVKAADAPTFHKHVEPILNKHCVGCHRNGQVAPFALTGYDDAALWAGDIKTFTKSRTMPPWMPAAGVRELHGERRLTDVEIATLSAWVDAGAPRGDAKDAPPAPVFKDQWALGTPDLILKPDADFHLDASGADAFRCFVFPTNFAEDRYVAAIEIKPGNARVVHHALLFVDSRGQARKLDAQDPAPGYDPGFGVGFLPTGGLGGWAPGNIPHRLADGIGRPLPKGADIVVQVHYHKSGKPETDRTQVGIWFAKGEVTRAAKTIPVANRILFIPAGADKHKVVAEVAVPRDLVAIGVTPHMHLLGKQMKVTATYPDGSTHELINIPDWDFNWQDSYHFAQPLPLPKGTKLRVEAVFDNSASNPRNPSSPPKLVTWGEQTTNEMCIAFVHVTTDVNDKSPVFEPPLLVKALLALRGRGGLLN